MASFVHNVAKKKLLEGTLDLDNDTIKILAITGAGTPNPDHATVTAVLAATAEANGTGYTQGPASASRKTVAVTVAQDDSNDRATATTAATSWSSVTLGATIKALLIYKHASGSDDSLNFPIAYIDDAAGLPFTTNGSDINLAAQVLRLT